MAYTPLYNSNALVLSAANSSLPQLQSPFNAFYQATNPTYAASLCYGMTADANAGASTSLLGNVNDWLANNASLVSAGSGLLTGGLGAWNGWNQNKLIEKQLSQQASQFNQQMQLQKQTINRNLEDRQAARVASNPNAYASVKDYMDKYGVK